MANQKKGEVVSLSLDGVDSNGDKISDAVINWYGFTNQEANQFQMAIVAALAEVIKGFDALKNGSVEVAVKDSEFGPGILR